MTFHLATVLQDLAIHRSKKLSTLADNYLCSLAWCCCCPWCCCCRCPRCCCCRCRRCCCSPISTPRTPLQNVVAHRRSPPRLLREASLHHLNSRAKQFQGPTPRKNNPRSKGNQWWIVPPLISLNKALFLGGGVDLVVGKWWWFSHSEPRFKRQGPNVITPKFSSDIRVVDYPLVN